MTELVTKKHMLLFENVGGMNSEENYEECQWQAYRHNTGECTGR